MASPWHSKHCPDDAALGPRPKPGPCDDLAEFGLTSELFFSWGSPPPRPPVIVGLRPPGLMDLFKKSLYKIIYREGRRPTILGVWGAEPPSKTKVRTLFWLPQFCQVTCSSSSYHRILPWRIKATIGHGPVMALPWHCQKEK